MADRLWYLVVRIEGEWEECGFPGWVEAQSAFSGLLEDYPIELDVALLIGPDGELANLTQVGVA